VERLFTLETAHKLLPAVEAALREAIFLHAEHQRLERQMHELKQRLMLAGGSRFDPEPALRNRQEDERIVRRLQRVIERFEEMGCQLKDLEMGLVDFPTMYRGEKVLLCWRLGEPEISHWHGWTEGFRGRKRIDEDFVQNHHAEATS
jgi:hypothetical protein